MATVRKYRRDNGLCAGCGAESLDYYCEECKQKRRESYRKNYNAEKEKERAAKARQKMIEEHRCVRCGVDIPDGRQSNTCDKCQKLVNKQSKKSYHFYVENGVCPRCRKQSILGDEKACVECRAKIANYAYERRKTVDIDSINERRRELAKQNREYCKENGLCTRCKKPLYDTRYSNCKKCRTKENLRTSKYRESSNIRERWIENGLCCNCGKERYKTFKICKECYDRLYESSHNEKAYIARQKIKQKGGFI